MHFHCLFVTRRPFQSHTFTYCPFELSRNLNGDCIFFGFYQSQSCSSEPRTETQSENLTLLSPCPVPQHCFLFKGCYPVPPPGSCAVRSVMTHSVALHAYVWKRQNGQGVQTCLQNKSKEVVLLFCFRPPYIRSPAYPSQSGAGGRPMFSSQHPNYGNSQAPMMHQPDQYG